MTLVVRNTGLVLGLPCSMLLSNRFLIWYDRILNGIKMPRQNKRFSCVQNVFMQCDKRDKNLLFFTLYFSQCTCNIVFSAFFTCDPVCRILLSNNYQHKLFCYFCVCVSLRNRKTTKSKLVSQLLTAVFQFLTQFQLHWMSHAFPIVSCVLYIYKRRNNNKNQQK